MSNFKFVKIYAARKVFTSWSSFVTSEVHRCFTHSTWVVGILRCQGMGDSLERARWRLGKIPAKSRTIRQDTSLFVDLWQLSFGTAQDFQLFLKNLKVALRWVGMCIHPLGCAKVWTTDKASLKLCPGGHARRVEVSWKHIISVHLSAGAHSQRCQLVLFSPFKSDLLNLFLAGNHDLRRTPAPPHLPLRDGRFCSDSFMLFAWRMVLEWYLTLLDCIGHIWLCYSFILFDIHWYPFQRWFNLSFFSKSLATARPLLRRLPGWCQARIWQVYLAKHERTKAQWHPLKHIENTWTYMNIPPIERDIGSYCGFHNVQMHLKWRADQIYTPEMGQNL